jgi:hypothetical protein
MSASAISANFTCVYGGDIFVSTLAIAPPAVQALFGLELNVRQDAGEIKTFSQNEVAMATHYVRQ